MILEGRRCSGPAAELGRDGAGRRRGGVHEGLELNGHALLAKGREPELDLLVVGEAAHAPLALGGLVLAHGAEGMVGAGPVEGRKTSCRLVAFWFRTQTNRRNAPRFAATPNSSGERCCWRGNEEIRSNSPSTWQP